MLNDNYQNIFIKFGLWLGLGIATMIVGISGVFADVVNVGYVTNKTTFLIDTGNNPSGAPITLPVNVQNTYGNIYQAFILLDNVEIKKDFKYYLEIYTPTQNLINLSEIHINGNNNQMCQAYGVSDTNIGFAKIWFSCSANMTVLTIGLSDFTGSRIASNGFYWNYTYLRYYTDDNDIDLGPIISNQTNNTNNIINNQNQNTQSIIDNQNQNTQDIINSNKVCYGGNLLKSFSFTNAYITSTGAIEPSNTNGLFDIYIPVSPNTQYIFSASRSLGNMGVLEFNSSKTFIKRTVTYSSSSYVFTTSSNTSYVRLQFNYDNNTVITSSLINELDFMFEEGNTRDNEICKNGDQALDDSINDLNSSLTDSSPVDMGSLGDTAGWLPPGPIDSIINLPLNLFNNLLTALNGTCQPINIPLPYVNKNLPIPCISTIFNQITGLPTFWNWVGAITSVVILYRYLLALYKYYDDLTTLKANFISDFGGEP